MRVFFVFLSSLLLITSCSHAEKSILSEEEASRLKINSTADCRVLNATTNTLHPLQRVGDTQLFETRIDDIRIGVTMEDPFILDHNAQSTVVRWRYFLLPPNAKFETFKQETYLKQGRGSFGEFLAIFSAHRPPNYEQQIASFQSERGARLNLYCMTTVLRSDSEKVISLKKKEGRYHRSRSN